MNFKGKYFVCWHARLAMHLISRGFVPKEVRKDIYNPSMSVWVFRITPRLKTTVNEYLEELKKIK